MCLETIARGYCGRSGGAVLRPFVVFCSFFISFVRHKRRESNVVARVFALKDAVPKDFEEYTRGDDATTAERNNIALFSGE